MRLRLKNDGVCLKKDTGGISNIIILNLLFHVVLAGLPVNY
jgi:hypothetical protein